jgi:hypothetical protein
MMGKSCMSPTKEGELFPTLEFRDQPIEALNFLPIICSHVSFASFLTLRKEGRIIQGKVG